MILPRIIGEPVMRLIRMSEHVGRPQAADWLLNTRSVETWAPMRWLGWNMAYHAEHHAVPSVPFHALPQLREALLPHLDDARRGYLATQAHLIARGLRGGIDARDQMRLGRQVAIHRPPARAPT